MSDFIAALASGTLRRLLVMLLGGLVVTLNGKFGLQLDVAQIAAVVALTVTYLVQSAIRQGKAPSGAEFIRLAQEAIEKAVRSTLPTPPERPQVKG